MAKIVSGERWENIKGQHRARHEAEKRRQDAEFQRIVAANALRGAEVAPPSPENTEENEN